MRGWTLQQMGTRLCMGMGLLALLVALALPVVAQSNPAGRETNDSYAVSWFSVDGGAGVSSGPGYTVECTIGQPDAGQMSGGDYEAGGGLWGGGTLPPTEVHWVYLPLIVRE